MKIEQFEQARKLNQRIEKLNSISDAVSRELLSRAKVSGGILETAYTAAAKAFQEVVAKETKVLKSKFNEL